MFFYNQAGRSQLLREIINPVSRSLMVSRTNAQHLVLHVFICHRAYSREDIMDMERIIVDRLEFNMSVPTPYYFMRRFIKAAGSDKKLELLSFLIEMSLVDYKMQRFQPSMLAAMAIYTVQCTLNGCRSCNKCCEVHTKYSEEQLRDCSSMIHLPSIFHVVVWFGLQDGKLLKLEHVS